MAKSKEDEEEYSYPHGDFEEMLPLFSAVRDVVPSNYEEQGLRGVIPGLKPKKNETREEFLKRVKAYRNKRIRAEKKADSSRKRRDKFLEENPSAFKDARGVRFKKGGIKGKSKKPKVRGAGIAQRGVRPAKMY
tara:strand:- start:76 stop:477 length:402 start_codon:yes stop_codon:yes gene_type:complete